MLFWAAAAENKPKSHRRSFVTTANFWSIDHYDSEFSRVRFTVWLCAGYEGFQEFMVLVWSCLIWKARWSCRPAGQKAISAAKIAGNVLRIPESHVPVVVSNGIMTGFRFFTDSVCGKVPGAVTFMRPPAWTVSLVIFSWLLSDVFDFFQQIDAKWQYLGTDWFSG